jgi:coproporphyrinogen III oxidase
MSVNLETIIDYLKQLQDSICSEVSRLDGGSFEEDSWQRKEGGGGRSRLLRHGDVVEKGGVNFSHVYGPLPDFLQRESQQATRFDACGVSLVLHSRNPHIPIIHMNVRYFETDSGDWWFGGGIDLTPVYPVEADVRWFHQRLKDICDTFSPLAYASMKEACDQYFYIPHRQEMRGVGGIFYDHQRASEQHSKADLFAFMQAVGNGFNPIYRYMIEQNQHKSWTAEEKNWQKIRRGRYAEFNLVYDRGTTFGLKTGGRTESILMSLPPEAIWEYNHQPVAGSREAAALTFFQPGNKYV